MVIAEVWTTDDPYGEPRRFVDDDFVSLMETINSYELEISRINAWDERY